MACLRRQGRGRAKGQKVHWVAQTHLQADPATSTGELARGEGMRGSCKGCTGAGESLHDGVAPTLSRANAGRDSTILNPNEPCRVYEVRGVAPSRRMRRCKRGSSFGLHPMTRMMCAPVRS